MKKNRTTLAGFVLIVVLAAAGGTNFLKAAPDETVGMAIIEDTNGDRIGVEPTSGEVWDKLVEMHNSTEEMWIGGVVEVFLLFRYDPNYPWGFRFKPENITVAEVTAEGLQTTIRNISEDVDYWINLGQAYVLAKVMEVHIRGGTGDLTGPNRYPDGKCDIIDIVTVALSFGSLEGDERYDPRADITGEIYLVPDDQVDIRDVALVAIHFGEDYT